MDYPALTMHALKDLLAAGEVTPLAVTEAIFARIDTVEERIGAFITINREQALRRAEETGRQLARGEGGPLCGIPLAIKDVICTKGLRTTGGSKILEPFIPPYNATVMDKLEEAGAIIIGKLSMDEFAMGSSNEKCAYGVPKNPWNREYICGGSSGGSAAAVAADESFASLGSDTGGSIRQPASHCGIVGLKPTYGRVSRFGLLAYASSLDQIGPLTKDVRDCALLLNVISGYDPRDSTSVQQAVPDYQAALTDGLRGMTLGIPGEYFGDGLDPEVEAAVQGAVARLQEAGATVRQVSLPHTAYGVAAYYIIAPAEASSNLARYDGVKYGMRDMEAATLLDMYKKTRSQGFGSEVKRRIIMGTYALSSGYYDAYYKKASQVRTLIVRDYQQAFSECDVLISPVTPTPAWKIGEKSHDPLSMYLSDVLTIPANLAGIPGLSVPCGISRAGLPIGLQIQGPHFQEEKLLRVGFNLEQRLDMAGRKPDL
ncbi:MAG: Asp-tRNA(Asn)/Glu-tRNA(Gln) amidotransferase subunit GatA [Thermodesulfobacteriota bacterium]